MSQLSVRSASGTTIDQWPLYTTKTVGGIAPNYTRAFRTAAGLRYLYLTSNIDLAMVVGGRRIKVTISGTPHYAMQAWQENIIVVPPLTDFVVPSGGGGALNIPGYRPYISYSIRGGSGGGQGGGRSGASGSTYSYSDTYHTYYATGGGSGGGGGGAPGGAGQLLTGTITTALPGDIIRWTPGGGGFGGAAGYDGAPGQPGSPTTLQINGPTTNIFISAAQGLGAAGAGYHGNNGGNGSGYGTTLYPGGGGGGGYYGGGGGGNGYASMDSPIYPGNGAGGPGMTDPAGFGGSGGSGGSGYNSNGGAGSNGNGGGGTVSIRYYTPLPSDG